MKKKCCSCDQVKDREHFNKGKRAKDGLQAYCRDCSRQKRKEYYAQGGNSYRGSISQPQIAPYPMTQETVYELYYKQKLSLKEIANRAETSRQRLARWMEYWGMKRRGCAEGARVKLKKMKGSASPNWKGGRHKSGKYVRIFRPNHPNARDDGTVLEHVAIMEEILGRYLTKHESVHHCDLNTLNNDPQNLCVLTPSQHRFIHAYLGHVGIYLISTGDPAKVMEALSSVAPKHVVQLIEDVYLKRLRCVSENCYS